MKPYPAFILVGSGGTDVLSVEGVQRVDLSKIEDARVTIFHDSGTFEVTGFFAFEALMVLKPSALEGKRLRWKRGEWTLHNLVGHPGLEVWFTLGRLLQLVKAPERAYRYCFAKGMHLHDSTAPRPSGMKSGE